MVVKVLRRFAGARPRRAMAGAQAIRVGIGAISPEEANRLAVRTAGAAEGLICPGIGRVFLVVSVAQRDHEVEQWNQSQLSSGGLRNLLQPGCGMSQLEMSQLMGDHKLKLGIDLGQSEHTATHVNVTADVGERIDKFGIEHMKHACHGRIVPVCQKRASETFEPSRRGHVVGEGMTSRDDLEQFRADRAHRFPR